MKYLINDEGRECYCCKEFKQWGEYGNHKKGTNGKKSLCLKCNAEDSYVRVHGCLKEDNIDPKHYDADKIMDKLNRRIYTYKLDQLKSVFGKSKSRFCQTCNELKPLCDYKTYKKRNKYASGYAKVCNGCKELKNNIKKCPIHNIELKTVKDRYISRKICRACINEQKKKLKTSKIEEAIKLAGENIDVSNGFIYLYRCEELDCFKIGRTIDDPREYVKVKSSSSNGNYGIKLDLVAYIVSPIRDCDAEWLATRSIKHKMVEYTKPCGGQARELFRCGLYEALLILRSISDSMYIEPNPFVSLDDLGAVEIVEHIPTKKEKAKEMYYKGNKFSGVVAGKVLRKIKYKRLWNVHCDGYTSTCECRISKLPRLVKQKKEYWVVNLIGKLNTLCRVDEISKEDINKKAQKLFDIRDKSYINGRYINNINDLLNDEIINIRREVRDCYQYDSKEYQKLWREKNKDRIAEYQKRYKNKS